MKYMEKTNLINKLTEPNLTNRLFGALWARSEISGKSRERLTSPEAYLHYKSELENKTIFGGDLFELFEKATVDEIRKMSLDCDSAPNFLNCYTLYFMLNDVLARLIDEGQELTAKAQIIHSKYLEIQRLYPELADKTDLFNLYLDGRKKRQLAEQGYLDGSVCPYCLSSEHIQHYGVKKMKCTSCNRYWRT